jgi:hypothetical protein
MQQQAFPSASDQQAITWLSILYFPLDQFCYKQVMLFANAETHYAEICLISLGIINQSCVWLSQWSIIDVNGILEFDGVADMLPPGSNCVG